MLQEEVPAAVHQGAVDVVEDPLHDGLEVATEAPQTSGHVPRKKRKKLKYVIEMAANLVRVQKFAILYRKIGVCRSSQFALF